MELLTKLPLFEPFRLHNFLKSIRWFFFLFQFIANFFDASIKFSLRILLLVFHLDVFLSYSH